MSADLFAEFNDLSSRPPPQQQQSLGTGSQAPNSASQDPFGFPQNINTPAQSSQRSPQSWGGFQNQPSSMGAWGQPSSTSGFSSSAPPTGDDDDGWGDFEVAEPVKNKPAQPQASPWQAMANPPPVTALEDSGKGRLVRASTLDIVNNSLVDFGGSSNATPSPSRVEPEPAWPKVNSRPKLKQPTDPSVLFDAAEFELEGGEEDDDDFDDDDFGDFETVAPLQPKPAHAPAPAPAPTPAPARKQPVPPPSMDLLSLDDPPPPEPAHKPKTKPAHKSSESLSFGATIIAKSQATPNASKASAAPITKTTSKATVTEDDDWAAWDDFEPAPSKKGPAKPASSQRASKPASQGADSWDWDVADTTTPSQNPQADNRDDQPPPINVPPPSVLLTAFPALFTTGNALFNPVSGQNASIKQRILSDSKAVDFLHGYVLIATTAARIIAGRKHRWHRDKILAKSMSISAAGSKGMKLAGVDKTQSAREDREAADVAAAWREHVGRLRSAVAAANSAGKASLKVPEIRENMPVSTAKFAPTAPKPCIICGLKREERVAKVDFDVEDSFGEWWADHWGHRACKNFWLQHEETLRQR